MSTGHKSQCAVVLLLTWKVTKCKTRDSYK